MIQENEVLEKEIEAEEQRINADERKIRNIFLLTGLIIILLILNAAIVYSFILKPRVISQKTIEVLPTPVPTISIDTSPTTSPSLKVLDKNIKEYFISLGSGTGSSSDWADVNGLLANINFSNYPDIKEIRFEVSTQVPTGNEAVWVRLYNKTDDHPVWNSDISSTGASGYSVSSPISFDGGEKIYQIQMKTQLKFPANITQSRLHIILN